MAERDKIPNMRKDYDPKGEDVRNGNMLIPNAKDSLFGGPNDQEEYEVKGGVPKGDLGGRNTRQ